MATEPGSSQSASSGRGPVSNTGSKPRLIAGVPIKPWLGFIIIAGTLAAYWPVFSAGFIWDDDAYVTENPLLTAPDGWWRIWFSAHAQSQYFPLVYSTLRFEYRLWGLNAAGYHVVNICLHAINALLVWGLLRRLALPGAWLAAAVFALHPVQVETVAWVTELKNTESTLFYLLALFAWLRFCGGKGQGCYALALGLQLLALFAKTTACTLPAAMLLVLWVKNEPVPLRRWLQVLPFLGLGLGMGMLSVWWEGHLGNYADHLHLLGGPLDRLLIATHALWFYAGKVFWPVALTFSYPRWDLNSADWHQYLWLLAGLALLALLWLGRRSIGIKPALAVIFFVAALSPMIGFIPLYTFYFSYVADHYQYLACVGLIALAAGGATKVVDQWRVAAQVRVVLAGAILLTLGVLTWRQCHAYETSEALWADTLRKNPRSWMAHTNLGRLEAQQNRFAEAEGQYQAALAIKTEVEATHYNYGNRLAKTDRPDEAITQYQLALTIEPNKADIHNNLASVYVKQHRLEDAAAEFQDAVRCKPDFADAYFNLGSVLATEHKIDAAIAAYRQALRLRPDSELYHKRLQALGVPAN